MEGAWRRAHHVDVLPAVPRLHGQAAVEAQRREGAEDVLVQRLVVAVDVVRHLREGREGGIPQTEPNCGAPLQHDARATVFMAVGHQESESNDGPHMEDIPRRSEQARNRGLQP